MNENPPIDGYKLLDEASIKGKEQSARLVYFSDDYMRALSSVKISIPDEVSSTIAEVNRLTDELIAMHNRETSVDEVLDQCENICKHIADAEKLLTTAGVDEKSTIFRLLGEHNNMTIDVYETWNETAKTINVRRETLREALVQDYQTLSAINDQTLEQLPALWDSIEQKRAELATLLYVRENERILDDQQYASAQDTFQKLQSTIKEQTSHVSRDSSDIFKILDERVAKAKLEEEAQKRLDDLVQKAKKDEERLAEIRAKIKEEERKIEELLEQDKPSPEISEDIFKILEERLVETKHVEESDPEANGQQVNSDDIFAILDGRVAEANRVEEKLAGTYDEAFQMLDQLLANQQEAELVDQSQQTVSPSIESTREDLEKNYQQLIDMYKRRHNNQALEGDNLKALMTLQDDIKIKHDKLISLEEPNKEKSDMDATKFAAHEQMAKTIHLQLIQITSREYFDKANTMREAQLAGQKFTFNEKLAISDLLGPLSHSLSEFNWRFGQTQQIDDLEQQATDLMNAINAHTYQASAKLQDAPTDDRVEIAKLLSEAKTTESSGHLAEIRKQLEKKQDELNDKLNPVTVEALREQLSEVTKAFETIREREIVIELKSDLLNPQEHTDALRRISELKVPDALREIREHLENANQTQAYDLDIQSNVDVSLAQDKVAMVDKAISAIDKQLLQLQSKPSVSPQESATFGMNPRK